jgi:hypothetical protein
MSQTDRGGEATWQEHKGVLDEGLRRLPEKHRTALVLAYRSYKHWHPCPHCHWTPGVPSWTGGRT